MTYTTAYGDARSSTYWVRPRIKPPSSRTLRLGFLILWATTRTPIVQYFNNTFVKTTNSLACLWYCHSHRIAPILKVNQFFVFFFSALPSGEQMLLENFTNQDILLSLHIHDQQPQIENLQCPQTLQYWVYLFSLTNFILFYFIYFKPCHKEIPGPRIKPKPWQRPKPHQ